MTSILKTKYFDIGTLLLRLSVGVLLFFHGYYKIVNGVTWIEGLLLPLGLPNFVSYGVFIGEVIAPVLLVAGFRTRIAALIIAFNMFMAVFLVFRDKLYTLKEAGGGWIIELEALFFFGALVLFFTGGGKYGLSSENEWD
jgi:putative oxidoreductase